MLKNRGVIIYNGIPLKEFHSTIKPIKKDNSIKLIMVASFRKQKNHKTLIKALSNLNSNYTLSLVGEGDNLENIKSLTKELNLEKRVHFLGFRNDIAELYRNHDIFVLSSHSEGFGLVAVEAMASGLPVIASNVDGLREVVDGAGLLFEPKNEIELAKQIQKVATNNELKNRMINDGLVKAKNYDIKNLKNKTLKLYKNILSNDNR
ncbi:MAG TPA: glycosyltransferase family 1 protein [Flavobacteriaceae bacterium]|nr:glycosyltransferase family 1 protein [Flavobacteriaceae bacterium]